MSATKTPFVLLPFILKTTLLDKTAVFVFPHPHLHTVILHKRSPGQASWDCRHSNSCVQNTQFTPSLCWVTLAGNIPPAHPSFFVHPFAGQLHLLPLPSHPDLNHPLAGNISSAHPSAGQLHLLTLSPHPDFGQPLAGNIPSSHPSTICHSHTTQILTIHLLGKSHLAFHPSLFIFHLLGRSHLASPPSVTHLSLILSHSFLSEPLISYHVWSISKLGYRALIITHLPSAGQISSGLPSFCYPPHPDLDQPLAPSTNARGEPLLSCWEYPIFPPIRRTLPPSATAISPRS